MKGMRWSRILLAAALGSVLMTRALASTPDDPRAGEQYGLAKIDAFTAWDRATGAGVTIGVIDTGADLAHPDLVDHLLPGYNALDPSKPPADDHGHGTHVAGIAGAVTNNARGVAGTAMASRILPVKVLDETGQGDTETVGQGITWAVDHGARVINLSLGSDIPFTANLTSLQDVFDDAASKGAVIVAAAGNNSLPISGYAGASNVIVVGATEEDDSVALYSTRLVGVSIYAPGSRILSTSPTYDVPLNEESPSFTKDYGKLSGTSMAAPFVSGVAALLLEMGVPAPDVRDVLVDTADVTFEGEPRVNAARAVASVAQTPETSTTTEPDPTPTSSTAATSEPTIAAPTVPAQPGTDAPPPTTQPGSPPSSTAPGAPPAPAQTGPAAPPAPGAPPAPPTSRGGSAPAPVAAAGGTRAATAPAPAPLRPGGNGRWIALMLGGATGVAAGVTLAARRARRPRRAA